MPKKEDAVDSFEYAKRGAKCAGQCKGQIAQGELRWGKPGRWKHFPGCLASAGGRASAQDVAKAAIETAGSADALPGLSDLRPEDRKYAAEAMQAIADNRPLPAAPPPAPPPEVAVDTPAAGGKKRKAEETGKGKKQKHKQEAEEEEEEAA